MCQIPHAFRGSIAVLLVVAGMAAAQPFVPPPVATPPGAQVMPNATPSTTSPPNAVQSPTSPPAATPSDAHTTAPLTNPEGTSPIPFNYAAVDYSYHVWFQTNFLLEWFKNAPMPVPFVTSGSISDPLPGALGQPHTNVVLGGGSVDSGPFSGLQFTTGVWFDPRQTFGIDVSYFFLTDRSVQRYASTTGQPGSSVLSVPYFDVSGVNTLNGSPGESVFITAGPRLAADGSTVSGSAGSFTQTLTTGLQGVDMNALINEYQAGGWRVNAVAGFRWLQLLENLDLLARTQGVNPQNENQFFNSIDSFHAMNNFYGGQVGGSVEYRSGAWTFGATLKVALGVIDERVEALGITNTNSFPVSLGGIFVQPNYVGQPGNLGRHVQDHFAATLDEALTVGYQPTSWLRVFAGYNFTYLSTAAQPGDQIDRNINTTLTGIAAASRASGNGPTITGPPGPTFDFHDSSFWAQGITFGIEIRY